MSDLIVKFDRIGRTGTTPEAALTVHVPENLASDPDKVAHLLFRHCRRYLMSREFSVSVDMEDRKVWIDGGRFGTGSILVAS
jgi:hypothetical protein